MRNQLANGLMLEVKVSAMIHNTSAEMWLRGVVVGVTDDKVKVKFAAGNVREIRRGSEDYRELAH